MTTAEMLRAEALVRLGRRCRRQASYRPSAGRDEIDEDHHYDSHQQGGTETAGAGRGVRRRQYRHAAAHHPTLLGDAAPGAVRSGQGETQSCAALITRSSVTVSGG